MNVKKILLHDLNFESRARLCHILSLNGYVPLEAANEQHAEILYRDAEHRTDLIIADTSFLTGMQWRGFCSTLPVIALVGSAEDVELGAAAQMSYLRRPFSSEHFLSEVRLALAEAQKKGKILIVDDDVSSRRFLAALLEHASYEVATSDSREAVPSFLTVQPDLVLTEIVMEGVEGLKLIQQLRRMGAEVKIVAMTAAPRAETYLNTARLLGAKAGLKRPFLFDILLRTISEVLMPLPLSEGPRDNSL